MKIGITQFVQLRPRNIRLLSKSYWNYCVCTAYKNIRFKVTALSLSATRVHQCKSKMMYRVLLIWSLVQRLPSAARVFGTCHTCRDYETTISN